MINPFRGCGTALVTPFAIGLTLDEPAYRKLIRFQIAQGIDFLVPCGTTGETPTLSAAEHLRLVEIAVEEASQAPRKVPVLGGAGGNYTAHVAELARQLERLGVDGILSVAPYYNKPTQEGLYQHFAAVAAAVKLPVVLYNVPGRTASNLDASTTLRLAALPNIVAIKEASANLAQMGAILAAAPPGFDLLSGDDALTLPILALGGQGLVSVASNAIPGPMAKLVQCARAGDFAAARALHYRYLALMEVIFIESSPGPIKCVLARLGYCHEVYRLPMVPVRPASREKIVAVMQALGL
ncbi:MAG TPA: 4-hydroxy-tetrahydrodipicolinate synthase [Terriglobales bacterium]|nr:4-hydroxy-tetrahydrodipicolinate synthase [Terriglobales bacterium]